MLWQPTRGILQPNQHWRRPQDPGGGGASYAFRNIQAPAAPGVSTNTINLSMNLGSGSQFVILALRIQNQTIASGITVNAASLTSIQAHSGNELSFWAGTATCTGSDTVAITSASDLGFLDVCACAWTATGLASTTKVSSNEATSTTCASAAAIADFVFAASGLSGNYNGSAQTPPTGAHTATGANGIVLSTADWTASAGGISGGNFTSTFSTFSYLVQAVWR